MEEQYDSRQDTLDHIEKVFVFMNMIADFIKLRAFLHDQSKLEEPEKSIFDDITPKLKTLTYGSDEYKQSLVELGKTLEHHYAQNKHHPEHFSHGIEDMNLVDLLEMFCDWCAATMRHEDGNIIESIKINKKRFKYDEILAKIFTNTAIQLQMGKNCDDTKTIV